MPLSREMIHALRQDRAARGILRAWRELTGGSATRDPQRRTLIACSGGCDSSALVLALAPAARHLIVGHVVHDLRPPEEALVDRDHARDLAALVGVPFVEANVRVAHLPGNLESRARRARYAALSELARHHACVAVATAHHADDQSETVLMRLLRGAGPRGLAGIRAARPLAEGLSLVRPMLAVTRDDAQRLCRLANWTWSEDRTNSDQRLLRNAIRRDILPALRRLAPSLAPRLATSAELAGHAADVIERRACDLLEREAQTPPPSGRGPGGGFVSSTTNKGAPSEDAPSAPSAPSDPSAPKIIDLAASRSSPSELLFARSNLRAENPIILGELIRLTHHRLAGPRGADQLPWRTLHEIASAITDEHEHERTFRAGRLEVQVDAARVRFSMVDVPFDAST